jgi:uncharacterized membrane protein YkoI
MTFTRRHITTLAAAAVLSMLMPSTASANNGYGVRFDPQARSSPWVQSYAPPQRLRRYVQNTISPSKAKAIAAQRVPGAKFVDISRSGGQYRVRMLQKNGKVIDVLIDAATGRVLN